MSPADRGMTGGRLNAARRDGTSDSMALGRLHEQTREE